MKPSFTVWTKLAPNLLLLLRIEVDRVVCEFSKRLLNRAGCKKSVSSYK